MPSTPRRLPSGSWNCYAYLGKDAEGKLIRRSVTRRTKAEARAAAVELETDAERTAAVSERRKAPLRAILRGLFRCVLGLTSPS